MSGKSSVIAAVPELALDRGRASLFTRLITRIEVQMICIVVIAVVVPMLFRVVVGDLEWTNRWLQQTTLASGVAVLFGYLVYRRMADFPGARATRHIWLSLSATYGVTIAYFLFVRADYSRYQLAASFVLAIACFYALYFIVRRVQPFRFLIVPGGEADRLATVTGAEWVMMDSPDKVDSTCTGVVADLRYDYPEQWMRFITEMAVAGYPVYHFKQIQESLTGRVEIEHLSENSLGSLVPGRVYLRLKMAVDWLAAFVLAPVLLPFMAVIAILIRLESSGPAFYRQQRMGYRGRPFTMWKFRTMADGIAAPAADGYEQATTKPDDARITRIGRILRHHRIDELPQIINILLGQMSWIGPRPEAVPLSERYQAELPFYRYRHIVRPGISGWAQVNQGHVTEVDAVHGKLHYDFYYIKHCSLWLDTLIVLRTARTMLFGFGAK